LAAGRSDDTSVTEIRFRVAWMGAQAARNSGSGEAAQFVANVRTLYMQLRGTHTDAQMIRYDKMFQQLQEGER
jgi:hypothetical protein